MNKLQTMSTDTFRYKALDGFLSEYFNKTHVSYNYNLAGNSISCTIYKMDIEASTVSEGAETSLQRIGPESPYRFIRISNVPLFNFQQVDLPIEWNEDHGYAIETRIECVANPTIVAIDVDDYVVLEYSSYKNLYRVVNCNPDTFEQISYNRLTLASTQYTAENIDYQISKRFNYVFETASVIDESTNTILNDILSQYNILYKNFLSEYYTNHGMIIRYDTLSKLEKYFKFSEVDTNTKIYSYFFKKYIGSSLITSQIDVKDTLTMYMRKFCHNDPITLFSEDEAKFFFYLIQELEHGNNLYNAYETALSIISKERTNLLKNKPKDAIDNYSSPYVDFFETDKVFYDLYKETAKIAVENDILININNKNNPKFLNNLKKLYKLLISTEYKSKLCMLMLSFFLLRAIPLKSINFNKRNLSYGK